MAYGDKYEMEWATPTADARLRIQQDGYSSSVTTLTPTPEPVEITWGQEGGDDLTIPLMVSTARIRFIGDSNGEQVKEVFDGKDTEYKVIFERDSGSGYVTEWRGFVATDLWKDNPHTQSDVVELEAIDGLALLENRTAQPADGENLYDYARKILQDLHGGRLVAGMEWYPYRDGNQLSADQLPMRYLEVSDLAFDELESVESGGFESKSKRTQRSALEGVLERFGMRLFQGQRGEWIARQRHRIQSDDTVKVWTSSANADNDSPETRDLGRSVPDGLLKTDRPRSLVHRLKETQSTYTYDGVGDLVVNSGFENSLSTWTASANDNEASRVQWDNVSALDIGETANDHWGFEIAYIGGSTPAVLKQSLPTEIRSDNPRAAVTFSFDMAMAFVSSVNTGSTPEIRLKVGSYYVDTETVGLRDSATKGKDVKLQIEKLPGPTGKVMIPEGQKVPVLDGSSRSPKFTLTEPARAGDTELVGDLSADAAYSSSASVQYYVFQDKATVVGSTVSLYPGVPEWPMNEHIFYPQEISVPLHTPSNEQVGGEPQMRFRVVLFDTYENGNTLWLDNVGANITIAGEPADRNRYIAADDQTGRSVEITHPIGDGPTDSHPKGLRLSGVDITSDWQEGTYASGDTRSGQSLEEMVAEHAMRSQRDTLVRRTHEVELRGSEELWPEDVLTIGGKQYTVSYLRRTFGTSGDNARVELTELKDSGTSGLTQAFSMESETTSGSGGGTTLVGSQTVDGAGSWDELTGKPFKTVGDGLKVTSDALNVEPADIAGSYLSDDGSDNLQANLGNGLEGDGSDNMRVNPAGIAGDGLTEETATALGVDSTVARTNVDETFQQDVTVQGSVYVNGDRIQIDQEVQASDNLLWINSGETGSGVTAGFGGLEVDRGTYTPYRFGYYESGPNTDGEDLFRVGQYHVTLQHDGGTGFDLHERVVGQTSGAEGYVYAESTGTLQLKSVSGTFDASGGETIEGQSSTTTASLTGKSVTDDTQAVATREDSPTPSGVAVWDDPNTRFKTLAQGSGGGLNADQVDGYHASDLFRQKVDNFLFFNDRDGSGANWRWAIVSGGNLQLDRTDNYGTNFLDFDHSANTAQTDVDWGFGTSPSYALDVGGRTQVQESLILGNHERSDAAVVNGEIYYDQSAINDYAAFTGTDVTGGSQSVLNLYDGDNSQWTGLISTGNARYWDALIRSVETAGHTDKRAEWGIKHDGRADFRSIYTDELVAKVFTTDLTQALAGSDFLTKSVATLDSAFTVPTESTSDGTVDGGTVDITVQDLPGAKGVAPFSVGDWLRARIVDNSGGGLVIVDVWLQITDYDSDGSAITDNGDGTHTFETQRADADTSATGKTVRQEAPILDYGQSGQGLIRRTVEGSDAPYSAIETWSSDPVNGGNYTTQVAIGDLSGFSGTNVSPTGWGLFSENVYLEGEIVAQSGSIAGILDVASTVYIGDDVGNNNAAGNLLVGNYTQGADPVAKALGSTTNDFVQIRGTGSSSTDFLRVTRGGNDILSVSSDSAQIASFEFTTTKLDYNNGDVVLGSSIDFSAQDGVIVGQIDESYFKQVLSARDNATGHHATIALEDGGNPTMTTWRGDHGNKATFGHYADESGNDVGMGAIITNGGNVNLEVKPNGNTYVDNLEVRKNARVQGNAIIDGTLTANEIKAGTLTSNEIQVDDLFAQTVSLSTDGAFRMGTETAGFWIGDFALSRQDLGDVTHTGTGADTGDQSGTNNTVTDSVVRDENKDISGYNATVRCDYELQTTDNDSVATAEADVTLRLKARDSSGNVLTTLYEKTISASGGTNKEGGFFNSSSLPSNTEQIEIEIEATASASSQETARAALGDTSITTSPESEISTSSDHVGPNGMVWRDDNNNSVIEFAATSPGGANTSVGDGYLLGTLTENSDLRTKDVRGQIDDAADILRDVRGILYERTDLPGRGVEAGVGAQDFVDTFDPAVRKTDRGYATVPSAIQGLLISGWQAHDDRLEDHEQRIQELEEENERLRNRLSDLEAGY